MRGRNWELCWGVGEVSGMWESMGVVWKSVWGECGGCVEVGESVLKCGEVWECGGANTLFYTSPHTHPTPLLTLTRHLSPALPHSPDMSIHTFPHSPPHTLSHFPTPLTPILHLPQYFPTLTPHTSSQPHASSNTSLCSPYFTIYPMLKFFTYLICCQISLV